MVLFDLKTINHYLFDLLLHIVEKPLQLFISIYTDYMMSEICIIFKILSMISKDLCIKKSLVLDLDFKSRVDLLDTIKNNITNDEDF